MINIETIDDVKILKELTRDSSKIIELEGEIGRLRGIVEKQNRILQDINSRDVLTAQDIINIVSGELDKHIIPTLPKTKKARITEIKSENDFFEIPKSLVDKGLAKEYNKIIVEGNTLIHKTVRNQKMTIPVTTVQLLYMLEKQKSRGGKLLNKDFNHFCKVFNLPKQKLMKVCYNLQEKVFFDAINSIDNQIRQSSFKVIDGNIYIISNGKKFNTEISPDTFNILLQIYINSSKEFETIFKLSMDPQYKKINPIHLLTVLKRHSSVSKVIARG